MEREELLNSKDYWTTAIQLDLFNTIESYMEKKNFNKTELARELNFSKGYITQVLNGDFDHKVSKMVDLSLSCDKVPFLFFIDKKTYINNDAKGMKYELTPTKVVHHKTNFITPLETSVLFPTEYEHCFFDNYELKNLHNAKNEDIKIKSKHSMTFIIGGNLQVGTKKVG